jgi:hypothetical protein
MVSYRAVERNGRAWLSLTPEPELELPRAIAALRAGGSPQPAAVAAEAERVEQLVLGGTGDEWRRWVAETRRLAEERRESQPADASLALAVIDNHDALALGIERRERGTTRR